MGNGKATGAFTVHLLGPFAVWRSDGQPLPALRTHKGQWLLALLVLRTGRAVSRDLLAGLLWPTSSDEHALYNLRRCLSDLRHALGPDAWRLTTPTTRNIALDLSDAAIDVVAFDTAFPDGADVQKMEAAVRAYGGPLLEGCDEGWVTAERAPREENFLGALERLAAVALAADDVPAALAYLRRAVACDPARETAQRALLEGLARVGDYASMVQAYRQFRRFLRDELNTHPAPETERLMRDLLRKSPPSPAPSEWRMPVSTEDHAFPCTAAEWGPAGGALPLDSRLYVERATDATFRRAVLRGDSIVLVKGPRQVGKSSLLSRGLQAARAAGWRVVVTDFQKLTAPHLESSDTLFFALAQQLADRLGIATPPEQVWGSAGPNENLERYLRRHVLGATTAAGEARLVWGLDEVDRLFSHPFGGEVFALFRSWHNERALDPEGPWSRLTLAIAYATEAHLFINDPNQSPFNVGTRLVLEDFTREEVVALVGRYREAAPSMAGDPDIVSRLVALVGGHPYLLHHALDLILQGTNPADGIAALEGTATREGGPFDDHLRRLWLVLQRNPTLCAAIGEVLRGAPCPGGEPFYRLRSGGVIVGDAPENARLRCALYRTYLQRRLSETIPAHAAGSLV